MSSNSINRIVLGISIVVDIEVEEGVTFAKSACPMQGCNHTDESADNGCGSEHAATITAGKIKTHLIMWHGCVDDSVSPEE